MIGLINTILVCLISFLFFGCESSNKKKQLEMENFFADIQNEVEHFNKTGEKNTLDKFFDKFNDRDEYEQGTILACLKSVKQDLYNENVEEYLNKIYLDTATTEFVKGDIIKTMSNFVNKKEDSINIIFKNLEIWDSGNASFASRALVKLEKSYYDELKIIYEKNRWYKATYSYSLVKYVLEEDERYKSLFKEE